MRLSNLLALCVAAVVQAAWWLEDIEHQGISAFNPDKSYTVWRNVKDFGAKGDGVSDDTAAINAAISSGNRCGPGTCKGNTITPAVVYFPAGTYLISNSIIDYFYTQLIGDATNPPTIKATANFPTSTTLGLIDGNQYQSGGALGWPPTNVFYRQIRNFVIDTTEIPASSKATGIHWPSSQATSITNVVFKLSQAKGNIHTGLFIEGGSGGLLNDLTFYGGQYGAQLGNQQYTSRNLKFYNADIAAISQLWSWSWTYKSLYVENCPYGIAMVDTQTASISIVDSTFYMVGTAVNTTRNPPHSQPPAAGSLVIDNVQFTNVDNILAGPQGVIVAGKPGGSVTQNYAMGDTYTPTGPTVYQGSDSSLFPDHSALKSGGIYYERSKPQYENETVSSIVSARSYGAKGDGSNDDTSALNALFAYAASNNLIAFIDAGTYIVTSTVRVPPGSRIVGESLSAIIMGTGSAFGNMSQPTAVVQIGTKCQTGYVEVSDLIVSTRGANPGAKLIEFNLNSPGQPSGLWDVHTRIGGSAGSNLQLPQCPTTPNANDVVNWQCVAAWMSLHITKAAGNLLLENNWLWVSDHDLEDPNYTQITIYAGRGLLIESAPGRVWLSATGVEHHTLYQYQLLNTKSVYLAMPQTETPYYQPNPPANLPFPVVASISDPDFVADCKVFSGAGQCAMAWGLRVLSTTDVVAFGAGLYSFFNNYNVDCSATTTPTKCQARILDIRDLANGAADVSAFEVYNLNTIGATSMVTRLGKDLATWSVNQANFSDVVAVFRYDS